MDPRAVARQKLTQIMQVDRFRLEQALARFDAMPSFEAEHPDWQRWLQKLERSHQRWVRRDESLPPIELPAELPITQHAEAIREALQQSSVLVVCGETGSGKSTQLPKICLLAGRGRSGMIGHTQPRRLAARTIASRLAEETQTQLGTAIGFKIRFTDQTHERSLIKLMTDGILLAETQSDRFLDQYDTLIIDEAHERSLNIDFLLGYVRRLLHRRSDLKVIITSATLDAEKFSEHFRQKDRPAPILEVEGRTFPVEVRYRPLVAEDDVDASDQSERDLLRGLVDALDEVFREGRGDTLVFLPTEGDIRAATKYLRGRFQSRIQQGQLELLPLYARLGTQDQNRVFHPGNQQRVVLATNVAESSLTVPGIHYVIDSGLARISRYAPRTKVQRLPIEAISQASADQRAGRCGRVGPGICIRLFSEDDYRQRDRYTTPEIRRTNLASVILQTEALRLGKITEFPFIDPPRPEAIRDGYKTLFELNAVDDHRRLTPLGRQLARLPVDPRVGRMIYAADEWNCLADMLILSAGLEIQDPRERPAEKKQAADEQHVKFEHPTSDFLSLLKVWDFYHELKPKLSQSQLRKACHQNFLSYNRLREWSDLHRQLRSIVEGAGMRPGKRRDDEEPLHRALLTGLLSGVALRTDKFEYTGAGGLKFFLWPGSSLAEKPPEWILVNEVVETSRRYGRTAAALKVEWIEPAAEHLVKRSYSDSHWHRKSQRPMTYERVTLFGLPIVTRRRVPLGPRDAREARQWFIHEGLVEQQYTGDIAPLEDNLLLLAELEEEAAKRRDLDFVVDPLKLAEFYEERIPEDAYDGATLRAQLQYHPELADTLRIQRSDLIPSDDTSEDQQQFPTQLELGDLRLKLDYRFEPGSDEDGVTVTVPVESLNQISPRQLGWLVPGLLEQRIIALIRSLPKPIRRQVVPAPDSAKRCVAELTFGEGNFEEAVASCLSRIAGEPIQASDFHTEKLADHLRMNVKVVNVDGEVVAMSRDLDSLRRECGVAPSGYTTIQDTTWTRESMTHWDLDELPARVMLKRQNTDIPAYPALLDRGDHVAVELVDLESTAEALSALGLTRLAWLEHRKSLRKQVNWLPGKSQWQLWGRGIAPPQTFDDDLGMCLARKAFVERQPVPRTREAWEARMANAIEKIGLATQDVMRVLPKLFEHYHECRLAEEAAGLGGKGPAAIDIQEQLAALFPEGYLYRTPWPWLQQFPRYLQALTLRLEKLPENRGKDEAFTAEVRDFWERYRTTREKHQADGIVDDELETFRWMIEEFRVSLWAQPLGTSLKVSPQRLEKQWQKVRQL